LSILLSILCLFTFSLKSEDECCPLKDVGGKLYTFSDHISEDERDRLKCSNTCAYKRARAEREEEQKFCFKPGRLESECKKGNMFPMTGKLITIESYSGMSGMINFKAIPPMPYTLKFNANNKFNYIFTTSVPMGAIITNITTQKIAPNYACDPYIHAPGGEQKWKFIIVWDGSEECSVTPASQQYHPIGVTEWEENGIKVKQEDFYHPITKEAILKTPAHGNNFATTMIFQSSKTRSTGSGLMVTAAGNECTINELP